METTYLESYESEHYILFYWDVTMVIVPVDGLGHAKLASLYGVQGTWIDNDADQITATLRAGHPVITQMGPGIFTDGGHYIVLRGITEDGYVLVNDPGSRRKNRYAYLLIAVVKQARTSNSFMVCTLNNNKKRSGSTIEIPFYADFLFDHR
jgi:hypothetical protein